MSCMTHPQDRRSTIAGEIRAELGRQQTSAAQLAAGTRISPAKISRRLAGLEPFYLEELAAIEQFLGLPVGTFAARTEVAA